MLFCIKGGIVKRKCKIRINVQKRDFCILSLLSNELDWSIRTTLQ